MVTFLLGTAIAEPISVPIRFSCQDRYDYHLTNDHEAELPFEFIYGIGNIFFKLLVLSM